MWSEKRRDVNKRASSIARNIALSHWLRRCAAFVAFDLVVCLVAAVAFYGHATGQLPKEMHTGLLLSAGVSSHLYMADTTTSAAFTELSAAELAFERMGGETYTFPLAEAVSVAQPVSIVVLIMQAWALLVSGLLETRRIRRKLRPLNELALTAEAMGSAAGDEAKLASLEQAIARASVDAPSVSTGDQDLRSIEVALNSLLRRMQEAKTQQMRFVSDASHELRTPIAVIQGYVNMLDRWGKDDPAVLEESIGALKAESEHMQELVEQLLFLARGDSGRQHLERSAFNMDELVREVVSESAMIDEDHSYAAENEGAPTGDQAMLSADRAMVKQAMRIMAQNAARYSPAGSAIRMRTLVDASTGRVGFSVQDQGVGIAAEDLPHVFDRFFRSSTARDEHRDGTGLGLAIAKWIVDAHEGQIEVLSHQGAGTRFTVWLPKR